MTHLSSPGIDSSSLSHDGGVKSPTGELSDGRFEAVGVDEHGEAFALVEPLERVGGWVDGWSVG